MAQAFNRMADAEERMAAAAEVNAQLNARAVQANEAVAHSAQVHDAMLTQAMRGDKAN
jgi:hypothetical protein